MFELHKLLLTRFRSGALTTDAVLFIPSKKFPSWFVARPDQIYEASRP